MKKLTLALIATLAVSSAAFAQSVSNGFIEFKGEVTDAACTIGAVDTVQLGSVSKNSLKTIGATGTWGNSNIVFKDCDLTSKEENGKDIASVNLRIAAGGADSNNSSLWKNQGTATNVGIEVEINNTPVKPAGEYLTGIPFVPNTNTLSIPVKGRMVATAANVAEGDVAATINFIADYK